MKVTTLFFAIIVLASVALAIQPQKQALKELKFQLNGLSVYAKTAEGPEKEDDPSRYKFDPTLLIYLIKEKVSPKSWGEAGVKIEPVELKGEMVLRIVQSEQNLEDIAVLISTLRRASPLANQTEEGALGVAPN